VTPKNLTLLFPDWNSLDSVRNAHSLLELWAIWLFAALVVCDIAAHLVEENRKPLAKIFERIGLCCFAVAVAAELAAYRYGQRNDELSQQVISSLDTKAQNAADRASKAVTDSGTALTQSGQAITKAGTANDIAGSAGQVAQEAQRRASAVGEEADALDLRMAEINGEVVAIEPRAVAIAKDDVPLLKQVSPFVGQKFEVQVCGPWNLLDAVSREKIDAWGNLVDILQRRAKWQFENQLQWHWEKCSGFSGVMLFFNSGSSSDTKKAAQALSEELTRALPDQMFPMLAPLGSSVAPPSDDADSAILWVAKHPDVIVVLIAGRIPQKSRPAAKPKTQTKP
jgi:hypothetical protein